MAINLNPEQLDAYLNDALRANSQDEFDRICLPWLRKCFPSEMDKSAEAQVKTADDIIRRRAVRRYDYHGPITEHSRECRLELPWTWYEDELLDRAHVHRNHAPDREAAYPPSVAHTALLFQRSVKQVEERIRHLQTHKMGVQGIDI